MTIQNLLSTVDRLSRRSGVLAALVDVVADRVLSTTTANAYACANPDFGPWGSCYYDNSGRCSSHASKIRYYNCYTQWGINTYTDWACC